MKNRMYSIRDKKAEAFLQPFFAPTDGAAMRSFVDACGDKSAPFCKHPEDFYLACVGIFDDSSGVVDAFESPLVLISAEQAMSVAG